MRIAAFVLLTGWHVMLLSNASAQQSSNSARAITLERVTPNLTVVPRWENGLFVSFDFPDGKATPAVYTHDGNGKRRTTTLITIPGSRDVVLSDAAVSPAGEVVVAGDATAFDGRQAPFLMFIDRTGKPGALIRTSPWWPSQLCFAPDGTLWALGRESDENGAEKPSYNALRQYGRDGLLVKSMLARDMLGSNRRPGQFPRWLIAAAAGVVGVYSNSSREWIELSPETGAITGRWQGVNTAGAIKRVAIVASGQVFVVADDKHAPAGKSRASVHRLTKETATWVPVAGMNRLLLGADGESLVALTAPYGVTWVSP